MCPVADGCYFTRAVRKRYHDELCRTAPATFEDHQIAVIKRARPHPHQDLLRAGPRVLARPQDDPVNAAETVDAVGLHLVPPPIGHADRLCSMSSTAQATRRV